MSRSVTYGDVVALAQVMLRGPRAERAELCRAAFIQSEIANSYRQRVGQLHLQFGDGSLAGWAGQHDKAPEPFWDNAEFLDCVAIIIRALQRHPRGV